MASVIKETAWILCSGVSFSGQGKGVSLLSAILKEKSLTIIFRMEIFLTYFTQKVRDIIFWCLRPIIMSRNDYAMLHRDNFRAHWSVSTLSDLKLRCFLSSWICILESVRLLLLKTIFFLTKNERSLCPGVKWNIRRRIKLIYIIVLGKWPWIWH